MIDLADQIVDALRDVLAALMRLAEIALQGLDALHPRRELLSQRSILFAKPLARIDQRADGAFEAFEVVRRFVVGGLDDSIADDLGNGVPPQTFRIVPVPRSPSRISGRFHALRRLNSSVSREFKTAVDCVSGSAWSDD